MDTSWASSDANMVRHVHRAWQWSRDVAAALAAASHHGLFPPVRFVIAIAGFTMEWEGGFQLGAIVLGSAAALVIYHLGNLIARARRTGADDGGPIPAVGPLGGDPT